MRYKETKFGKIPWDWAVLPVKAVAEVVTDYVANGSFASLAKNVKYKETEDVAILIRLVDYNNGFKNNFVYIDEHAYEFLAKSKLFGDEIIISNVGINVGTVFRCPHLKYKMSLGPNAIMVRFAGNNDFYYYWLKGFQGQQMLRSIVTGSVQPKFNKTNFRDMLVPVPPIVIQNRIVTILNCLDRKIELNNKIKENLEQQAQAIFRSWFLDYLPFNSIKPTHWKFCTLGETTKMSAGGDKPKGISNIKSTEYPYPIYSNGLDNEGLYGYTNEAKIFAESVTVSARGTIGFVCLRHIPYVPIVRLVTLIPNENLISAKYLYLYLKQLRISGTGTTQQQLTVPDFRKTEILIPDKITMDKFTNLISPMFNQIWANGEENIKLASLRDSLLPKLMSGEIEL